MGVTALDLAEVEHRIASPQARVKGTTGTQASFELFCGDHARCGAPNNLLPKIGFD
jgi:hypothetical protein